MKIGAYEILSTIGKGGMGVVYRARTADGRIVAVKVLIDLTGEKLARFERERRLLDQLGEAEGFVPLLDAGDNGREPFIVMPFVGGGTLRDRLERGPLGIEETVRLGRELSRALARAHALGIIHRDLKPENILYTDSGRALVADLGLAKHFDQEALGASQSVSMSVSGMWRGTPGYMAPEQMKDAKTSGPSADVFALGAILYECLAGARAFEGEGLVDVLQKAEQGAHMPLGRARPGVPADLVAVIDRALAADPARRYPDASVLARALEKDFLVPSSGRSKALGAAALVLLLVAAGGLAWQLRAPAPRPVPPPPAPPPHRPAPPAPTASVPEPVDTKALLIAAVNSYALGDLPRTLEATTRIIALEPRNVRAWDLRGVAKADAGDFVGAIEDLTRALELEPTAKRFAARAAALHGTGDVEAAIADYGRSIDLDPGDALVWHHRGELLFHKERLDDALADLDEAVKVDPRYGDAHFLRGAVLDKQHRLEPALEAFEAALRLGGSSRSVENTWRAILDVRKRLSKEIDRAGEEAYARRELDLAIALCTKAIAIDDKNTAAWLDRGVSFSEKNCLDLAIADYTKAIEINPKLAEAYSNRGVARSKKPDLEGAQADYTKAIELSADFSAPRINRALLREKLGDDPGALEDFKRFLELEPNNKVAGIVRARIAALTSKVATGR